MPWKSFLYAYNKPGQWLHHQKFVEKKWSLQAFNVDDIRVAWTTTCTQNHPWCFLILHSDCPGTALQKYLHIGIISQRLLWRIWWAKQWLWRRHRNDGMYCNMEIFCPPDAPDLLIDEAIQRKSKLNRRSKCFRNRFQQHTAAEAFHSRM